MTAYDFYKNILHMTDEKIIQALLRRTEIRHVKAGTFIANQGEMQNYMEFLIQGILRGFYIDSEGREITDCFSMRCGDPAVSTFGPEAPSPISIEASTDCELLSVPIQEIMFWVNSDIDCLKIYNELLKKAMRVHWEIKTITTQHTAIERYQWFLKAYPGLIDHVSNKRIASFLGMTPVTLSRLRRAIREGSKAEA